MESNDGPTRAPTTAERLDHLFSYHAPQPGQQEKYEAIRAAGKELARVILATTPGYEDQSMAIRKVREAVMTANAAIALGGST